MSVKSYPSKTPDLVRTLTDESVASMGWQASVGPATVPPMAEQDREVGERLQRLRERRGWSRETLAYHADVSTKTVERIEKGQVEGRRGTLRSLAEALEVDEYAILGEPAGPSGVALSDQVSGGFEEFRGYVASLEDRLAHLAGAIQETRTEAEERAHHFSRLIKAQNELLTRQSAILERIEVLVATLPTDETTTRLLETIRGAA